MQESQEVGLSRSGRTIAVMPAYNAASTLRRTVGDIPPGSVDQIILVDDCSRDNTVQVARELGLTVIEHQQNRGYGGNQKTCYRHALDAGADYVVMIHPDYQYDSRVIPLAVEILRLGICDLVSGFTHPHSQGGARRRHAALQVHLESRADDRRKHGPRPEPGGFP